MSPDHKKERFGAGDESIKGGAKCNFLHVAVTCRHISTEGTALWRSINVFAVCEQKDKRIICLYSAEDRCRYRKMWT